jgi:hypothetical protein
MLAWNAIVAFLFNHIQFRSSKMSKDKNSKNTPVETKTVAIPNFFTNGVNGATRKLDRSHFPKTKEGKAAFCDYMIAKWTWRKEVSNKKSDPNAKLEKQKENLQKKLDEINAKLAAK